MSAAETLREAAKVLRGRAEAATPGPWAVRAGNVEHYFPYLGGYGVIASPLESDATLIATMHPGVALALADWLDDEARMADWEYETPPSALRVAEAILGGAR